MAQSIANPSSMHAVPTRNNAEPAANAVERDPGPWLTITGPFLIALTVLAVSWLSMISF